MKLLNILYFSPGNVSARAICHDDLCPCKARGEHITICCQVTVNLVAVEARHLLSLLLSSGGVASNE